MTDPVSRDVYLRVTPQVVVRSCRLVARVFALASIASLAFASSATAASPCAKEVLSDWYDNGRIDGLYALHCYDEAIDAVPHEIRDYADAEEVIARALQDAARVLGLKEAPPLTRNQGARERPPIAEVAPPVNTSAPSTLPIPLLVLASMSLVLLGAGAFGYYARRRREGEAGDGD